MAVTHKAEGTCGVLDDVPTVLARNKDDWYGRKHILVTADTPP
jgi:hypothetical protein